MLESVKWRIEMISLLQCQQEPLEDARALLPSVVCVTSLLNKPSTMWLDCCVCLAASALVFFPIMLERAV